MDAVRPHSVDSALLGRDYAAALIAAAHEVRDEVDPSHPDPLADMADLTRALIMTRDPEAAFACILTLAATAVLHPCPAAPGDDPAIVAQWGFPDTNPGE